MRRDGRTLFAAYESYAAARAPAARAGAARALRCEVPLLDDNALPAVLDGAPHPRPESRPESVLSAGATAALRSWLEAARRAHAAGAEVPAAEARRAVRAACDEARRRGVQIERVIVLVKQLWATLPPTAAGDGRRVGEREALESVVSLCIEEFYAPADGAGRPA